MSDRKTVSNTTREAASDPLLMMIRTAGPGGIEAMEAAGQRELVASEQIPTDLRRITPEQLAALGFVLGDPTPDDPMFRPATLPRGWSRRGTDHSMWSTIVDEKGRERFSVFYKSAFYDRSAHMGSTTRYSYSTDYEGTPDAPSLRRIFLTDGGERLECVASYEDGQWEDYRVANDLAAKVLAERWPDHQDPMAYWD
jgi:hypothetical protein